MSALAAIPRPGAARAAKRRCAALRGGQLRFQRRVGRDQRAGRAGEPDGRRRYGPDARRDRSLSLAEPQPGRPGPPGQGGILMQAAQAGSVAASSWGAVRAARRRGGGFGGRRRHAEFPRLQSRPAARGDLLDRKQLRAECGALQPARTGAGAARIGHQSLRPNVHERAVHSGAHQAERQRHGISHALRRAHIEPDDSTRQCPRMPSAGDFSAAGLPPIYDPATGQQFVSTARRMSFPRAIASHRRPRRCSGIFRCRTCRATRQQLQLPPADNGQSNTTQAGVRYKRSLGANAHAVGAFGRGRRRRRRRRTTIQGLRQSINFNYNWAHSASDHVNIIPQLGGKSASDSNSLQAGYTVGYHRVTSIFNASWNRSNSHTTNFFTNTTNNRSPGSRAALRCPTTCRSTTACPASPEQSSRPQRVAAELLDFADHLVF